MNQHAVFRAPKPRVLTAVGLVLALIVTFFTGSALSAAPATAAPGDASISSVAFENSSFENGSRQMLQVGWNVAAEADGDVSFRMDLPPELVGNAETIPMAGIDQKVIGECVVTATEVVCTVDPAFTKDNPFGIEGGLNLFVTANFAEGTTGDQKVNLNGDDITVTIAEERPPYVCTENCDFGGNGFGKRGWYDNSTDTITWEVSLPAPKTGIEPGQQVTISDLADPEILALVAGEGNPRLEVARSLKRHDNNHQYPVWERASEPLTLSKDGLTMEFVSEPGLGADHVSEDGTVTGLDGSLYRAVWVMSALDGGKSGSYPNKASYTIGSESDTTSATANRETQQNGSAWVIGKNFGMVQVAKQLAKGSTATIEPSFEYTITYVATHDDGTSATGTFVLRNGASAYTPEIFKDTTVTFTEITPTGGAAVTWKDPVFLDEAGKPLPTNKDGQVEIRLSQDNGNLGTLTKLLVVNEAVLNQGSFSAHKEIVNADSVVIPEDAQFTLNYTYAAGFGYPAGSGTIVLDQDGTVVSSDPVPLGATVTLTEATPAAITGATWDETPVITPNTLTIDEASATVDVTVQNTLKRDFGSFTVTKALAGDGAAHLKGSDSFSVNWSYPADKSLGFAGDSGTLTVTPETPVTVTKVPAGAVVTLSEDTAGAKRPGTTLGTEFDQSTFSVVGNETTEVTLTNTYELERGSVALSKKIDGSGAALLPEDAGFLVTYAYPEGIGFAAGQGEVRLPANGDVVTIDNLPYGAEVTFSEQDPEAVPGATWTDRSWSALISARAAEGEEPAEDDSVYTTTVTGSGTFLELELTNTLTRDVGSFSVTKSVTGSGAGLVPAEQAFDFGYSYPAGETFEAGSGTISVPADGTPVTVGDLPSGAVVTLTEAQPAITGGTWAAPVFTESNEVVIATNETVEVAVVNEITLNTGLFQIAKTVEGSGASLVAADTEFLVDYAYPANERLGFAAGSGTLTLLADGTPVTSEALPYGAEVTLSEQTPADVAEATWALPAFTVSGAEPAETGERVTLTIGDQTTAEVALVNAIEKNPAPGVTAPTDKQPGAGPDAKNGLANTGSNPAPYLIGGAIALLLGAALVVVARIRRRA